MAFKFVDRHLFDLPLNSDILITSFNPVKSYFNDYIKLNTLCRIIVIFKGNGM